MNTPCGLESRSNGALRIVTEVFNVWDILAVARRIEAVAA